MIVSTPVGECTGDAVCDNEATPAQAIAGVPCDWVGSSGGRSSREGWFTRPSRPSAAGQYTGDFVVGEKPVTAIVVV